MQARARHRVSGMRESESAISIQYCVKSTYLNPSIAYTLNDGPGPLAATLSFLFFDGKFLGTINRSPFLG